MKKFVFFGTLLLLGMAFKAPVLAQNQQNQAEGKKLYAAHCASCHGEKGKGDGVAAVSLPVRPKDHTDGTTMNKLTDQFLINVITKGGAAMGKSGFMPAWGSSLNEMQVRGLVAFIRTLAVPPYNK